MLLGAGALLCFAGIADNANAAARHHRTRLHYQAPSSAPAEATDLSISGNNPAKRAAARSISNNAVTGATLMQSGNNPAKRYATRHAPDNAASQPTLMTNGNNPAKRAPGSSRETTAAGASNRR